MIVYSWDQVICEISEWVQDAPPKGISDKDLLLLADARITAENEDSFGTYDQKFRNEGGVLILDAKFGRDVVVRTYLCRENPAKAKALAKKELEEYLEED